MTAQDFIAQRGPGGTSFTSMKRKARKAIF